MTISTDKQWFNQYPKEIPHTIQYADTTLHGILKKTVSAYPNHDALHFNGKEMTYAELYRSVTKFANALKDLGLQKGDPVSIMLPNCPQGVIAYYGILMAGGIVVQTNPLYVERELEHQLADSGAKYILCLDLLYKRVLNVKKNTNLQHIIVTAIKDYLPFPKNLIYPFIQKKNTGITPDVTYDQHTHRFPTFLKNGKEEELNIELDPKEDIALLQYTGGTTGPAKGVMLTHSNLISNTTQCAHWMYQMKGEEERTLAALPFFHVYGMTVSMNLSIMNGSKMFIVAKFNPLEILQIIDKHKITIFPGAPTMYIGLINHPDIQNYDLSSIKTCISGSAALPVEVQSKFEELTGGKLVEGYGLTEASPVTHCNLIWGHRQQGSIGLPWPDTEAVIFTEPGEVAKPGEVGELAIRGPQVMKGYWNRPEDTAATFYEEWLLTGDMGYMDEQGYFYIVDRKKDMIIAGGFNIYPREIEEVLYEHESVLEAVVIGLPDPYRGETVKAFVVKKEGASLTEKDLNEYCRKNLAAYKVPRLYEFRDELPKTMVGKILKRVLIEEEEKKQQENKKTS
ncbi:long-chain-fatty-acid--CoA ligase [Alkalihalobacillus sp. LMS39]|uniref:long-chain-fatty-acid--CoA ligase n=1 Tax=Alkalihalobacillus sp. LMS39 TaxID=2924032 RepID=UPI0024373C43|nr:long-chain-fatty-acid--CoA ligase [Alkalihalobacillus sp. LMS39]